MNKALLIRRLAFIPLIATLWSSVAMSNAQDLAQVQDAMIVSNDETVMLKVGDILEIKPVHNLQNPTYTWILTQDRTFIEANRSEVYRKRQIQPGRYTLYAEVTAGDQSARITRTFFLDYKPRDINATDVPVADPSTALVTAMPVLDQSNRIILPEASQLIRLDPRNPDIKPLALDLDLQLDQNGDGNPANDLQSDGTFFQSDASPIYLWFANPTNTRSISVTAVGSDGTPIVQKIDVLSESFAREQGLVISPIRMDIRPIGNMEYSYSASFLSNAPTTPILHHWDFGDEQRSILPNPTHAYAEPRTYRVSVRIQNLTNGKEIASQEQELVVEGIIAPASSAASEPVTAEDPTTPPEDEQPNQTSFFSSLGPIAMLGGIFLGSVLFGVIVIVLIVKLRGKNADMSDRFAAMEANLIGKEGGAEKETTATPPPLTIPGSTASSQPNKDEIVRRELDNATTNPLQEKPLKIEEGNAPAWLKSGISGASVPKTTPQSPAPTKQVTPAPTQPAPVSAQTSPPWLQQNPLPSAAPQTKPAPASDSTKVPSTPSTAAVPVQAPENKPTTPQQAPAPSWLQQKPASALSQPSTTPRQNPPSPAVQPSHAPAKTPDKAASLQPQIPAVSKPIAPAAPSSAPAPIAPPSLSASAPQTKPATPPSLPQMPSPVIQTPQTPAKAPDKLAAPLPSASSTPAQQISPTPAVTPASQPQNQEDRPIAIIRAESLESKPGEEKKIEDIIGPNKPL